MAMSQCSNCGEWVYAGEDHQCKQEDMERWYQFLKEKGDFMAEFHPLHKSESNSMKE